MLARAPKHVQTEQSFTAWDCFNFILKGSKPNSRLSPFWKTRDSLHCQCVAFVSVIYYLFQTKCLFSNVCCQSLLQLLLFQIPKGSLGLIFAVRTQIMRRQTWRCVQSSNKWTSKDSAFQLQQALMPIKWLILEEFWHCSILILQLTMYTGTQNPDCY